MNNWHKSKKIPKESRTSNHYNPIRDHPNLIEPKTVRLTFGLYSIVCTTIKQLCFVNRLNTYFFFYPMKDPLNGCILKWTSPVKQASDIL